MNRKNITFVELVRSALAVAVSVVALSVIVLISSALIPTIPSHIGFIGILASTSSQRT